MLDTSLSGLYSQIASEGFIYGSPAGSGQGKVYNTKMSEFTTDANLLKYFKDNFLEKSLMLKYIDSKTSREYDSDIIIKNDNIMKKCDLDIKREELKFLKTFILKNSISFSISVPSKFYEEYRKIHLSINGKLRSKNEREKKEHIYKIKEKRKINNDIIEEEFKKMSFDNYLDILKNNEEEWLDVFNIFGINVKFIDFDLFIDMEHGYKKIRKLKNIWTKSKSEIGQMYSNLRITELGRNVYKHLKYDEYKNDTQILYKKI